MPTPDEGSAGAPQERRLTRPRLRRPSRYDVAVVLVLAALGFSIAVAYYRNIFSGLAGAAAGVTVAVLARRAGGGRKQAVTRKPG